MGVCGSDENNNQSSDEQVQPEPAQLPGSPPVRRPMHQDVNSGLPDGWIARRDPRTGRIFYQNNRLRSTQWDRPTRPSALPKSPELPRDWVKLRDPRTGRVYFQNNRTKATTWDPPANVDTANLAISPNVSMPNTMRNMKVTHEFTKSEQEFIGVFKASSGDLERCETAVFEYGECAVCFEALYENKPTVLTDTRGEKRTCRHFICYECAHDVLENGESVCPLCRTEFKGLRILPDIAKKPKEWFDICDFDGTGQLRRQELTDALTAILPIPASRIQGDLDVLWNQWDGSKTGKLSSAEALTNVVPYVQRKIDLPIFQQTAIPDLTDGKQAVAWFDYWDMDGNGVVDKYELARGLLKTFGQYMRKKSVRKLINNVLVVTWMAYSDDDEITVKEFVKEDGLADTLRILLMQVKSHGPGSESESDLNPGKTSSMSVHDPIDLSRVQLYKPEPPARPAPRKKEKRGQGERQSDGAEYFQMPPSAAPARGGADEQKSEGPGPAAQSGSGDLPLGNYSPDELARMDDETLQAVLSSWYNRKNSNRSNHNDSGGSGGGGGGGQGGGHLVSV